MRLLRTMYTAHNSCASMLWWCRGSSLSSPYSRRVCVPETVYYDNLIHKLPEGIMALMFVRLVHPVCVIAMNLVTYSPKGARISSGRRPPLPPHQLARPPAPPPLRYPVLPSLPTIPPYRHPIPSNTASVSNPPVTLAWE